nr:hypothetical protein BaRGS_008139 [Batillaria attramentaria]
MTGAVKDIRRSNYVCKLQWCSSQVMGGIHGGLEGWGNILLYIDDGDEDDAMRTELNLGLVRKLLQSADRALHDGHISHIGSSCLWARHSQTLSRLSNQLSAYKPKEILTFLPKGAGDLEQDTVDWKYIYMRCFNDAEKKERVLSPEDFIKLFPL